MATPDLQRSESPEEVRELLTFLREESASAREHLRSQAKEDRELLTNTIKIVAFPLTAIIAVAAALGFKSLSDLKDSIQREARNETKTEIVRMRAETDSQIKGMQGEIRSRLDAQFQTKNLRDIVQDAAKQQTQTSARPLILAEVTKQVKSRVDAEQGNIRNTVTSQTQAAVKGMAPEIEKMVKNDVDAKIQTQVTQIVALRKNTEIQGLINRMNADDAQAFDALITMPLNSIEPEQRKMVISSLKSVVEAHNSGIFMSRTFNTPMTDQQLVTSLSDNEAANREAAVEALQNKPNLLPLTRVVEILNNDPSLTVRSAAHRIFNDRTHQKFQILNKGAATLWWNQHKSEYFGK